MDLHGTIVAVGIPSIPSGFLECNGAAVSRTTYSALFAIVGTTYGAGDGSSTFNVPDLQDNVAVGKSGTKALASTGGANTVAASGTIGGSTANATLSTAQLASQSHTQGFTLGSGENMGGDNARFPVITNTGSTGSGTGHSHNMSANFSGTATSVLQPYLAVIYIIKT